MPGLLVVYLDDEIRAKQTDLDNELIDRGVDQRVADSADNLVVRDGLPLTDFGGTTTGSSSATSGYRKESWFIDMTTYQRDGSTASSAGAYNEAINVDLNKKKVVGIMGVKKGSIDNVSAIKLGLPGGVQTKDVWQIDFLAPGQVAFAETPIIFDSGNKMQVQYFLKTPGPVDLVLYTRVCERVGDNIMGGAKIIM